MEDPHELSLESDKKDTIETQSAVNNDSDVLSAHSSTEEYRLYKRRFSGIVGLVVLAIVTGMPWPWFGPISNDMVAEFGITLDQVNWLGTIMAIVYLPVSLMIPEVIRRWGIRRCCDIGVVAMLISGWVRYAGTVHSLSTRGAYALLVVGQIFSAVAQPIFQVMGPKYSETWFDLKGRTTATMIVAIANPVGGAIGQLLSPIVGNTRQSILVLAIISSAAAPFLLLINSAPPTPPTYSASKETPGLLSLLRAMLHQAGPADPPMNNRERLDFAIMVYVFGILSSALNVFAVLTAEILQPVGYSSDTAGFMGAALLLSGIVAAIATAPLFDRVFTFHLGITLKLLVPIIGACWLSLIWAVKPNNTAGLYAICVLVGVTSVTVLPVTLELACEVTRNADGSAALLWFACNLFAVVFILVEGALRAGHNADPPLNMHRALMFNGILVFVSAAFVLFIKGKQTRKQVDQERQQRAISLQTRA
ncbi:major facilitator superfamily domain-containing protein [Roridomyces roridus]|uniref:Major facilitator superfamily domain-containing protein n=1 Tax=Roridomyces roridus TaxID=1738132 RepID=A0AAD7CFB6_9AGAR|nr:major facilitator superfamily domain-containing protein [Roridomyces roridus]